jgi:hypothetical protein
MHDDGSDVLQAGFTLTTKSFSSPTLNGWEFVSLRSLDPGSTKYMQIGMASVCIAPVNFFSAAPCHGDNVG